MPGIETSGCLRGDRLGNRGNAGARSAVVGVLWSWFWLLELELLVVGLDLVFGKFGVSDDDRGQAVLQRHAHAAVPDGCAVQSSR
jgi:hypothetical protein